MKYHQQVQLKNGATCVLRHPTAEDAAALIRLMRTTSSETEYLFRYPDEITTTETEEIAYLRDIEASANRLMLIAEVNGQIVASAGFDPVSQREKARHRAMLGIALLKEYWGCGIGSHLMAALLHMARRAGYEQLELDVVGDNRRAIALYEKFGFQTIGMHPQAFRCRDGRYQSLTLMVCTL